jgi:hypothetical protein
MSFPWPIFRTHFANAKHSTLKSVVCQHCCHRYAYRMERTASGMAFSPPLFGGDAAEARAAADSVKAVQRTLEDECDAVPCPQCGAYQPNMVEVLRNQHNSFLRGLAAGVLLLAGPLFAVFAARIGVAVGVFALSATASMSISLFALRQHLARRYDPNAAIEVDRRKAYGRSRVADAWRHYGTKSHNPERGPVGLGPDGKDGVVIL